MFFSPFPHGTCSLSVTVEYLAFRDGPRSFRPDSSCPAVLRSSLSCLPISFTGLSPCLAYLPMYFSYGPTSRFLDCPLTPEYPPVWAPPLSLATTYGIVFTFFSCRYLDVSVPCVLPSLRYITFSSDGFPHSDINGSFACLPLPVAFRRLLRPSSPYSAQASSIRSSLLFLKFAFLSFLQLFRKDLFFSFSDLSSFVIRFSMISS